MLAFASIGLGLWAGSLCREKPKHTSRAYFEPETLPGKLSPTLAPNPLLKIDRKIDRKNWQWHPKNWPQVVNFQDFFEAAARQQRDNLARQQISNLRPPTKLDISSGEAIFAASLQIGYIGPLGGRGSLVLFSSALFVGQQFRENQTCSKSRGLSKGWPKDPAVLKNNTTPESKFTTRSKFTTT